MAADAPFGCWADYILIRSEGCQDASLVLGGCHRVRGSRITIYFDRKERGGGQGGP